MLMVARDWGGCQGLATKAFVFALESFKRGIGFGKLLFRLLYNRPRRLVGVGFVGKASL